MIYIFSEDRDADTLPSLIDGSNYTSKEETLQVDYFVSDYICPRTNFITGKKTQIPETFITKRSN